MPMPNDDGTTSAHRLHTVDLEGPADILRSTTLLDTPLPSMLDAPTSNDRPLREILGADLLILCISGERLFSETEQRVLDEVFLPLMDCPIVAAVTFTDRIKAEDDRREITSRLSWILERTASPRIRAVFVPGGKDVSQPLGELQTLVRAAAERHALDREQSWLKRVLSLLGSIEPLIARLPADVPPATPALVVETFHRQEACLIREHRLSLLEAEAKLRSRMSSLRLSIPDRCAAFPAESLQHEGVAQLMADVQAIGREAAQCYVDNLRAALSQAVEQEVQVAGGALNPAAADQLVATAVRPDVTPAHLPPRDMQVMALTGLGAVLIMTSATLVPIIGGALAIYGAHSLRRLRRHDLNAQSRESAVVAFQDWLTVVETDFITKMRESAAQVVEHLKQRLATISSQPAAQVEPTVIDVPVTQGLVSAHLAACRTGCQSLLTPE